MRMKTRFRKVRFLQMRVKKVQRGKFQHPTSREEPSLQYPRPKNLGNSVMADGSSLCCFFAGMAKPLRGLTCRVLQPRVARSSQPWAGGRNPVGIADENFMVGL